MRSHLVLYRIVPWVVLIFCVLPTANGALQSGGSKPTPLGVESIPAYHSHAPKRPLPATLSVTRFTGDPLTQNAYRIAARMKTVLYQLPCFCYCDKGLKHTCLLDCYTSEHAAMCEVCKKELFYAYLQKKRGKSVESIRQGIVDGEWGKINLDEWESPQSKRDTTSRK